jgi:hypothetical protein
MKQRREPEGLVALVKAAGRYRRGEADLHDAISHAHARGSSLRVIAEHLGEGFSHGTVAKIVESRRKWAEHEKRRLDKLDGNVAGLSSDALLKAKRDYVRRRQRVNFVLGIEDDVSDES